MSVLVVISAHQEWEIVRDRYPESDIQESPYGQFFRSAIGGLAAPLIFFHGGWGKISAAASAQWAIDTFRPDLLLNLGTCGGFEGEVERGS
tara:strand:- start:860 stop:1132 length:273 start_codon:yes stop_codon:yes gene_type:complete